MNPLLQVSLLGSFRLLYEGFELNTVKTARLQSLFAFIILHGQAPISRQQLACLFWPDTSESQARTNLRNLLHQLRQALPTCDLFIYSDADVLEWRKEASFTLDVTDFERCLEILPGQRIQREALEQAVEIYQGDLLPGCYEDWIIPERERLRIMSLYVLEILAVMAEDAREYPIALGYIKRLILADPLSPTANQQLIRFYSLLGDRPAAQKAYQVYADLLQSELGIEPDPEMQDLYERIRQASYIAHKPPSVNSTRLVGRKAEWGRLRSIWQTAVRGCPQIVFISGEAGIGKTRLVEELANWAAMQGIYTATAYCYPAEGSLPYAPVLSWLRAQPIPAMEKIWLVEIARLMPEVLQKNPSLPQAEPLHEAWQRQRLFEALARALLAKRQGLILMLEDIHWCDQDTLEWLHFLLRFDPKAPLMMIATVRSGEVIPDSLAILQTTLRNEGRYAEIEISPLNENETLDLIGQASQEIYGQGLGPEAASQIYHESEGNPLFAVELVRLGRPPGTGAEGGLSLDDSERVKAVLSSRINQLSPGIREEVCLAAAIGREFNMDVLYQASGESSENIVKAIDEMLQRRIIQEISLDTYDFTHDRLRQAAFGGLSTAHRRLLHRKVAEAYQRLDKSAARPRNAEIASHYDHAGLYLPAIEHYRLAAESAALIYANAEAQRYLQRAVELAETLDKKEDPNSLCLRDFADLLERWGDMLAKNGKYPQAQTAFERALAQPYSFPGIRRSQICRKISDALIPQYQHQQAHAVLDQAELALDLLNREGTKEDFQEWIQIQLNHSLLFYWNNCPEQMDAIIQKIQPIVERDGSLEQQNNLLNQQCLARIRHERYRLSLETVEIGRRILELAETLGDPFYLALAYFQLGFVLLWYGDPRAAHEWLARGYEATARIGARLWQARCLAYLSIASRKLDDLEALREQTRELLDLSTALDEPTYHGISLANLGWLAWREGNGVEAERLCKAAYEDWDKFGGDVFHGLAGWVLLAAAVSQRNLERAASTAQTLLDPNPAYRPIEESTGDLLSKGLSACQAGQTEAAFKFLNQAIEQARESGDL